MRWIGVDGDLDPLTLAGKLTVSARPHAGLQHRDRPETMDAHRSDLRSR